MDTALPGAGEQNIVVRERLRLLSLACYIRGAIVAAFSSFFLIYVAFMFGITMVPDSVWTNNSAAKASPTPSLNRWNTNPSPTQAPQAPPKVLFRIIAGIFGILVLVGWALGGLTAYAGWSIHKRRRKVLIYIVAGFNCFFIPYGTLLGIAMIIVMSSPGACSEFQNGQAAV
jgi:hypothetical protein